MDVTVIFADDHPLFRSALQQAVQQSLPDVAALEVETIGQLFEVLEQHPTVELVFLDLHMPGNSGFTTLSRLKNHHPDVTVVMVSSEDSADTMLDAIDFGASAFIPKSADFALIQEAIHQVLEGEIWLPPGLERSDKNQQSDKNRRLANQLAQLTPQQYNVLVMMAEGKLNKQIAYDLDIQETTVKKHVSAILGKLEVHNRTMAGMLFQRLKDSAL